jgi:uncharacterized phage protein gp47/JayE
MANIFIPRNSDEIRDQFLRDIRLEAIAVGVADPPIGEGTDWHILATAHANVAAIQYANFRIADDNADVLTAEGQALEDKRLAFGLPEVKAAGSSGKIVVTITGGAAVTFTDGTALVLPDGKRAQVSGTQIGIANGGELDIAAIDTGESTNHAPGAVVRFVSPPLNVATDAKVSKTSPLTGGTDAESDSRKRARILNRIQNTPNGSNWASLREIILNAVPSIQDVYVYPALGGPGSVKVVCVKDYDASKSDYTRTPTAAQITAARSALHAEAPSQNDTVVQAAASALTTATVRVTLPESSLAGGNGNGWTDREPWPPIDFGGGETGATVSAVSSTTEITVGAATSTAPIANQAHIAWWSSSDMRFRTYLVTDVGGGAGAWALTVDKPMVDSNGMSPVSGDFICPAAANLDKYGATWVEAMRKFGPGENTTDARLPRALRHPLVASGEAPIGFTVVQLKALLDKHPEITDIDWGTVVTSAAVPASVDTAPNILRPYRFGVYRKV